MARTKRVLNNTAETELGVTYQVGYPIDDNENADGYIAWGKLIALKSDGTSLNQYGSATGLTLIEADSTVNGAFAQGILTTTTSRNMYGALDLDSE
jgi:hypothetical protein